MRARVESSNKLYLKSHRRERGEAGKTPKRLSTMGRFVDLQLPTVATIGATDFEATRKLRKESCLQF